MAESVTVDNMPDSGSKQNVAFKLWNQLQYALPDDGSWQDRLNRSLDLYATCLQATNFGRKTKFE